jgi:ABC-type sugar transport systems, ATPase components
MSLLAVAGLAKSFADRRLLAIETLSLSAGERYVLTGENGSGKSTLLRILAGIDAPDGGSGHFREHRFDWHPYPDWLRREVIYVHQQPYLFHTSVAENIAYGLRARGIEASERERLVRAAIAWARLGHLLRTPPQKLSGGKDNAWRWHGPGYWRRRCSCSTNPRPTSTPNRASRRSIWCTASAVPKAPPSSPAMIAT